MKNVEDLFVLIGQNMKKIRTEKINNTQEKLAEDINISRAFISQLESSKINKGVSLDTLFYIAQQYNIDIRDFFEGYENLMNEKKN